MISGLCIYLIEMLYEKIILFRLQCSFLLNDFVLPQSDFFLSLTLFCPNQFVCYAMFVLL